LCQNAGGAVTTAPVTTTTSTNTPVVPTGSGGCNPSGFLTGIATQCITDNGSDCCVQGQQYPIYTCSPQVTANTPAILTINGFESGEDGGGAASCTGRYHSNTESIAALSTGWFAGSSNCGRQIKITNPDNGLTAVATIVDECSSTLGCDSEHGGQPPCDNNIVDVSATVWASLGVPPSASEYGWKPVTWTFV
jgi:hypothetical protein